MSEGRLFCFGYGYTAAALAVRLRDKGWSVAGTTTSADKAARMTEANVSAHVWRPHGFHTEWLEGASAVLVSTPPDDTGCPSLAAAQEALAAYKQDLRWIGYLSTNGVYGDYDGAWVDEESALRATSARSIRRIQAETGWRRFADEQDLPLVIFRLPGIYGPGRSAIDTVRAGKARRIYKQGQVFSRMHVDDIAAALDASLDAPRRHAVYNLADDEPAPPQDVIEYACRLLGVEPPPLTPIGEADLSPMAKSFYADNKRVSNARMKETLLDALAYPTYREGLSAIMNAEPGDSG